jgi:Predicted glycosyltransferases
MFVPLTTASIDLATTAPADVPVARQHRRARVLVRWSGVPVGIVEVSTRHGYIRPHDVFDALRRIQPHALPREAVRRALLTTGIQAPLQPSACPPPIDSTATPRLSTSVAVCTRDRPDDLASCLASLARLDPPPREVLIVDNAPSTDATRRLVLGSYPQFRYIEEPRPGLDHARNRGITEATGEIIAFTDDDVVVDPNWVGTLAHTFASDPAIGLVTGLAEPLEQETDAQIFFENYGGFGRGCRRNHLQSWPDRPLPWTLVGAGQLGAGANMALRREVFARVGLFDPALDVGTPTLGGGDHDMFFRVLRAGFRCIYDPTAVVRHRHRRTVAELRRLLFSYGHATRCFFDREEIEFPSDRRSIRRLRRWWWREWAWNRLRRAFLRPALLPPVLVWAEIEGYLRAGGAYRRARRQIVPDETARPDAGPAPSTPLDRTTLAARRQITLDVASPLRALPEAADTAAVDLLATCRGQPLGLVHIPTFGQPLSASRLADEIAHALWSRLLDPTRADTFAACVAFLDRFRETLPVSTISSPPDTRPVTIVVTTCNRPAQLRRCLASLQQLRGRRSLQIVVVDNRPDLNVAAPVVREFTGVELVFESQPGSSAARNAGVAAARGDFIAMVDDDMHVAPDWLERLLAPFARDDVMAVTGNTLPARLETDAERLLEAYGGFGRGFVARDFDRAWFHRFRRRAAPTWQIGGSGNAVFRREVFSDVARFDPLLGAGVPTGVGEDTKLFYDLLHRGFTIAYEPAAVAWHHHRVTMPDLRRQLFAYSKGHVAYQLRTFADYRDGRALVRIFLELPLSFLTRALARIRRRNAYPLRLIALEIAGTLLGPWSLWRASLLAQRNQRQNAARQPAATDRKTHPVVPALELPS